MLHDYDPFRMPAYKPGPAFKVSSPYGWRILGGRPEFHAAANRIASTAWLRAGDHAHRDRTRGSTPTKLAAKMHQ